MKLRGSLSRVRETWRRVATLEGLLVTVAVAGVMLLAAVALEATLHLAGGMRLVLLLAILGSALGGLAYWVVRPYLSDISDECVAVHVERRFPELRNGLINSVQLVKAPGVSGGFVAAVVAQASRQAATLDLGEAVDRRRVRKAGLAACCAVLLLAALYAVSPGRFTNAVRRLLNPGRFVPIKGRVEIEDIQPADGFSVLAGAEVPVKVRIPCRASAPPAGSSTAGPVRARRRTACVRWTLPPTSIPSGTSARG